VVLPVHGLGGGCGATTMAVNLAWELAITDRKSPPAVCLIDLDLQFGSVSTYLDMPRRDAVYELLSDTSVMDRDAFMQALLPFNDRLQVLTAPPELLPLDLIGPEDIDRIIDMARANFDYVVIDMPSTVVQWTETVLHQAHVYFACWSWTCARRRTRCA
jgi:pilus assembly protein CpaE